MLNNEEEVLKVLSEVGKIFSENKLVYRRLLIEEISRRLSIDMNNATQIINFLECRGFVKYFGDLTKVEHNLMARPAILLLEEKIKIMK